MRCVFLWRPVEPSRAKSGLKGWFLPCFGPAFLASQDFQAVQQASIGSFPFLVAVLLLRTQAASPALRLSSGSN
mgnify:FL=1